MRLSTTINFFIKPDMGSLRECVNDMRRYVSLGFPYLDAIFCSADAEGSPLRARDWEVFVKSIRSEADALGVVFVQSHVPFYNFCDPSARVCADIDEIVNRSIISAGILGAPWTVAHPATVPNALMMSAESKAANLAYFENKLKIAKDAGVGIAIENMADFEGGGRRRSYCATFEELCDLIDALALKHDNVGACWDFGHANLMYAHQGKCLEYLGSRLKVTHVHDNSGARDEHLAPWRGSVEWHEIMRTLAKIGYERDFSFEVRRIVRTDVPEDIKNSLWRHIKLVGEHLLTIYEDERTSI